MKRTATPEVNTNLQLVLIHDVLQCLTECGCVVVMGVPVPVQVLKGVLGDGNDVWLVLVQFRKSTLPLPSDLIVTDPLHYVVGTARWQLTVVNVEAVPGHEVRHIGVREPAVGLKA